MSEAPPAGGDGSTVVKAMAVQREEHLKRQQRHDLEGAVALAQWAKDHPADAAGPAHIALVTIFDALAGAGKILDLQKQVACVAREIALRRNVYPKWVAAGKLKQETATHELAAMDAVIETLKQVQVIAAAAQSQRRY